MPVVIRELVVRAQVGEPPPEGRARTEAQRREDRAQLVEEAVREVMRLLREEREP